MRAALVGAVAAVLAAGASAAVPLSIARSGHATVPVVLDGVGRHEFVFDTGAEGTAVYQAFSAAAKFASAGTEQLVGQTGSSELQLVKLPRLSLDGVAANEIEAVVLPPRSDGVPLAGIVGLDVFGGALVDFDLPARRLALHRSNTRLKAMRGAQPVTASATSGGLLTVPVLVNGAEAVAVIDTGARKTRINWKLATKLGFTAESLASADVIHGATNVAVESRSAVVERVKLGQRELRDQPVLVADLPVFEVFGVADRPAVILGMDWLDRTRLIVDFPQKKVWFVAASASSP